MSDDDHVADDNDDMIISADWVLTAGTALPLQDHAVRVVDGRIDEIAPTTELTTRFANDDHYDGTGCVLMPGFVNSHTHLYGVLAHGIPVDNAPSDFWAFLNDYWWPKVEDALDLEMLAAAAKWGAAELAATGTTTFFDITEAPNALPGALATQAQAIAPLGLRAILTFEATERMSPENAQAGLQENVAFITAHGNNPRTSGAMSIHTTFTCGADFIRQAFNFAAEHNVTCHAHVNEGTHEPDWCLEHHQMRTLEYYDHLGVASSRMLASQCVQLSDSELDILADRQVRVSHMPLSNCEVGAGIAPLLTMLDRNITVGLGSDGYINDMFQIMRAAFLLQRAASQNPAAISAGKVIELATEGSAKAIGLERVGRLEPGWHADLTLTDLNPKDQNNGAGTGLPTPVTEHNLADQLVLWRNGTDVRRTMAAGKWIYAKDSSSEVSTVDLEQLRHQVQSQATRLWR